MDKNTDVDVVVAGGGSNCVSLGAALFTLAKRVDVRRVAGTSAGGLAALALAFDVPEARFSSQLEGSLSPQQGMPLGRLIDGDLVNFMRTMGWARGDALRAAAGLLVGEKTRLGDAKIPVAVVVGDMCTGRPRTLSSWETPDVLAADAAVATAAIPFVFSPQTVRGLGDDRRLFCDGGTARNFALDIFDDDPRPTIGIRPRQSAEPVERPAVDVLSKILAFGRLLMFASDHAWQSSKSHAVIEVPAEDGMDFTLDRPTHLRRWAAGVAAAHNADLPGGAS